MEHHPIVQDEPALEEYMRRIAGALEQLARSQDAIVAGVGEIRAEQLHKAKLIEAIRDQLTSNNGAINALMHLAEDQLLPEIASQSDYAQQFVTAFHQWRTREAEQWRVIHTLADHVDPPHPRLQPHVTSRILAE